MASELEEAKDHVIRWSKIRDKHEKLSYEMESDRASSSYRYANSIEDIIQRAKTLDVAVFKAHDVLWNFDKELSSEFMGLEDIQQIIHVGRLGELDKRDALLADIEAKSARITEILGLKESLEVEMAPAGVVNFIYKHLNNIQEELRKDVMTFVQHKASML